MATAKRVGVREIKKMVETVLAALAKAAPKDRSKIAATLVLAIEAVTDTPTRRATGRNSKAWRDLERLVAKAMRGKRISRGDDFSRSDVDVRCEFRALKIDAKFRAKHGHHTFVNEIIRKYCTKPGDVPVLVTKTPGQQGAYVTVPLDHYAKLIDLVRGYQVLPEAMTDDELRFVETLRFKPFKIKKVRAKPAKEQVKSTLARVKPASRAMLHEILLGGRGTARMVRR